VLAGDPDPLDGARIGAAAECHHVPGGATARYVYSTDERTVVQAVVVALLRFQDAAAVDELQLVGCGRETANADEITVLAIRRDPFLDQVLVRQGAVTRVDRLVDSRRRKSVFAFALAAETDPVEVAAATAKPPAA
jgi:hypothetical protein